MLIVVNGHTHFVVEPHTLAALLRSIAPIVPFAVSHNDEFVPRASYEKRSLAEGDRIDIVHPTVGG